MAVTVNPNRMELLRLKRKRQMAIRGHKLLKDKLEGLLKDFMDIIKEYKTVRRESDEMLSGMFRRLVLASSTIPAHSYSSAFAFSKCRASLEVKEKAVMNVRVPSFAYSLEGKLLSYGLDSTNSALDDAMNGLKTTVERMVRMAELEKTIQLVALEIEKTRRRVNALEYIMIPQLGDTIKQISGKLDELERGNIIRLMKIKQILDM